MAGATHELKRSGGRQTDGAFPAGARPLRAGLFADPAGKPHENGVAERSHFWTTTAIEQALLLRGDRDFVDESAYLRFVRAVVDEERNLPAAARLAEERAFLRPLLAARIPEYTTFEKRSKLNTGRFRPASEEQKTKRSERPSADVCVVR